MTQHGLRSLRILLAEDDDAARLGLTMVLETKAGQIFNTDNGESGLALFKEHQPDVVISDIRMPRMDGLAMVRAIRELGGDPFIVIASGVGEEQSFLSAIELGVNLFIKKPYTAEDILSVLDKAAKEIARRRHDAHRRALSDSLLSNVPNCHMVSDGHTIIYYNDPQSILGAPAFEGQELGPYLRDNFTLALRHGMAQSSLPQNVGSWLDRHIGREFILAGTGIDKKGLPVRYLLRLDQVRIHGQERFLLTFTDISRIESEKARFYQQAGRDFLTGVGNRQAFQTELSREIGRSKRYGTDLSLAMLDIDDFKAVNDNYGHQAGDAVLVELSRLMAAEVRVTDMICRYGGEEFMVVMPQTDLDGALACAEKLNQAISSQDFGTVKRITVSMGVTQYQSGESARSLIHRVDTALYEAKNSGKNRVVSVLEQPSPPHSQA